MVSRKRWIAVLATVAIGALAYTASGVFSQTAHAQAAAEAAKDAPAPAAAPAAVPVDADHERVENPYGFAAMYNGGDFVTKFVLYALGIMSLGSWYIAITKLFEQYKLLQQAAEAKRAFWAAGSVKAGTEALKEGSAFRYIAEAGINASGKHEGALLDRIDLNTWIAMSIQRASENVQSRLQDGLSFLATVGSTAPFVGLFGTVWGIYHALTAIGIAGQASIDKVAGPVGEALIMTAIGLGVAVPAVLFYNWLVRRNKVAMEQVRAFGADLHLVLLGGGK